ncbi:MAG: class I adenylate-forming enzyme family protein [Acutalibacteraceae bacterium]
MRRVRTIWSDNHSKENFINEYPDFSLFAYLKQTAEKYPDNTAVEFQNKETSFSEMISQIEEIAKSLLEIGIRKGDYVTVIAPNTPQALFTVYAINRIGAIANMINPLLSVNEVKTIVENVNSTAILTFDIVYPKFAGINWSAPCNPTMIIAHISDALPEQVKSVYKNGNEKEIIPNPLHKVIDWKDFLKRGADRSEALPADDGKGEDDAAVLYSGGTTGLPKGVIIQNKSFNAMVVQTGEVMPHDLKDMPGKKVLGLMPLFHGFGLAMCIHVMINLGCHIVLVPKFDHLACIDLIFKKKIGYVYAVPALYEALSRSEEIETNDLSFLELVAISGDKCSQKLMDRMNKYLEKGGSPARMTEAWGLTESLSAVTLNPFFEQRKGSCGIPLSGNEIKIVKPGTHEEVPFGEDGEVCVITPTLMRGYYNNEEETALALQKHPDGKTWLHTGDIACMDKDGYLYYRQRHSKMVIVSGFNVYPIQIEEVINKCEGVAVSCVVGIESRAGTYIAAVVQPVSMDMDLVELEKQIFESCKQEVAEYAQPRKVVFWETLPRTAVGKINFKQITADMNKKG